MEEWYYKRDSFKRRNPVTRLVWHEKEVKATLLSKINQTVKIQLQGIDKQEISVESR